jgi:ligand-binding sensor domain-containing protein/two-component sensor histidine kinase
MRILLSVCFFAINTAFCQLVNPSFRHLTVEDGLSQSNVYSILQDHQGYLWFGTQDGLNRYDGYNFTLFNHQEEDTNSLAHDWIWDIIEDDQNNLWIATWFGLSVYNPHTQKFSNYSRDINNPHSISGQRTNVVFQDSQKRIWIGTWGEGLNLYIKEKDQFLRFRADSMDSSSIAGDYIREIYEDNNNLLWISSWGKGLNLFDPQNNEFRHFVHDPADPNSLGNNQITSITGDKGDFLWIGTWGKGLYRFNKRSGQFIKIGNDNQLDPFITNLYRDRQNRLWIGTNNKGLYHYNTRNQTFSLYTHDINNTTSISGNFISSIFQDNSGILWVGAMGLNKLYQKFNQFQYINQFSFKTNNLNHTIVNCFYNDKDRIWTGTMGGGINIFSGKSGFEVIKSSENKNSLSNDNVTSITRGNNGHFWIGTYRGGLNRYIPQEKSFVRYHNNSKYPVMGGIGSISGICFDSRKRLWVGTVDQGLYSYQTETDRFKRVSLPFLDTLKINDDYINTIYEDSRGIIWVGHGGGGLSAVYPDERFRVRFLYTPQNKIINDIVNAVCEDDSGTLWIGTADGLLSFYPPQNARDYQQTRFEVYRKKEGLSGELIKGILKDNKGNLWITTNGGLSKFNIRQKTFNNYNSDDGLHCIPFSSACLKDDQGVLYFGGHNGFNIFHPDSISQNEFIPPVVITDFKIFDKKTQLAGLEDNKLDYNENFFSFEFAALDFMTPKKNQYAYMMEGLDNGWNYSGTRRFANYTNLDPGSYTFRVKGSNSDGIWNEAGTSLSITIAPPFWQTWWFMLIIFVLISSIIITLHNYRVKQLLELEKIRVKIASDLHDDVGSTLTKISMFSDLVNEQARSSQNKEMLSRISDMSRTLIGTMSDIVWAVDVRKDHFADLIERMKEAAFSLAKIKDLTVNFDIKSIDPEKEISAGIRQNIFLIFKEAVNNVVKHSTASRVDVKMSVNKGQLELAIHDNGDGLPDKIASSGNGLKNMQLRTKRMNGTFEMNNNGGLQLTVKNVKV